MYQGVPHREGKPPIILVKTWLSMYHQSGSDNSHIRVKADDLLKLVFGSVEAAQAYVNNDSLK